MTIYQWCTICGSAVMEREGQLEHLRSVGTDHTPQVKGKK